MLSRQSPGYIGPVSSRVGFVGCVKTKLGIAAPAEDLYQSSLFVGRRHYVEDSCDSWWILSAMHGLVHPKQVLEPYDMALKDLSSTQRRAWAGEVLEQVRLQIQYVSGDVAEIHAGSEYRDFGLAAGLRSIGFVVEVPTQGLRFGPQLSFYKQHSADRRAR